MALPTTSFFIHTYVLFISKFVFLVLLFKRQYFLNNKSYTEIVHNKFIFFTISAYEDSVKIT